jgi:DNA-binding FadR family transcriptional regulator
MPFNFLPAVKESLSYGIRIDPARFDAYSDLRNHVESAYWMEAVQSLNDEDKQHLRDLMEGAWEKLHGFPVQIPHAEHRELHLAIFRRLENPFVQGLLEAYWEAYEEVGLNRYAGYRYLEQVWTYHQTMVDAICAGDYALGFQALLEHTGLIHDRPDHVAQSSRLR